MGVFNKQSIVLTTKRLRIGERSIELDSILEVYADQQRLESKMVVRLKNVGFVQRKLFLH